MQKDVKIHLDSMYSSKFANREFFVIMKKDSNCNFFSFSQGTVGDGNFLE